MAGGWNSFFGLKEHQTSVRRELLAGVTTFMTMAYIVAVNPMILGDPNLPENARMPVEGVMAATCLASAIACIVMGLVARYPFALAPGMGINAYFAYVVAVKHGYNIALGAVFLAGVTFLILTFVRVRQLIIDAVPAVLKHSVAAGIGLFIAFIGFQNAGLVVPSGATMVTSFGKLTPQLLVAVFGLALMVVLFSLRVRGAILIGIVAATVLALFLGIAKAPEGIVATPSFSVFGELDVRGALGVGLLEVIFAFLFVGMFDAVGTVIGLADRAGYLREGKLPRATHVLASDATGTVVGSILGTSTVTSYIESAAGIEEGGRTGLTAIFVGLFFLAAMFLSPIVKIIPKEATAPALIVVGAMMIRCIKDIAWDDPTEMIPAFVVMAAMPFFYSIAQGIAMGFIFYPVAKVAAGKGREVHWLVYVLGLLFVLRFILLGHIA
jgi:AGZA family xanthine/uracil permease-like MFS transporter